MRDLNYFAPYEDVAAGHENQLTRGLLVLLRYVPMVQAVFLDLIRPEGGWSGYGYKRTRAQAHSARREPEP